MPLRNEKPPVPIFRKQTAVVILALALALVSEFGLFGDGDAFAVEPEMSERAAV